MKICSIALAVISMANVAFAQGVRELPEPYAYPDPAWSPYLAGGLIGLLVLVTLALANKKVGASSAYSDLAGMIVRAVAPRHAKSIPYYQENKPRPGWTLVFVIGTLLGAYIAAYSGGEITGRFLQDMWIERFGAESFALRILVALVGGGLMAYGARMAGGCTSGHGISGTLQLAVGSWIAVICFFIGGIIAAMLMYRI